MKRYILVLFVSFVLLLSACDDTTTNDEKKCPEGQELNKQEECVDIDPASLLSDEELILAAKAALDLTEKNLVDDVILPTEGLYGVTISWESNNPDFITNTGTVTRPEFEDGDKYAALTATITYNEITVKKTINVVVIAKEEVIIPNTDGVDIVTDRDNLSLGDISAVTERLVLPYWGDLGSKISWESSDERLIQLNGFINRPGFSEGDQTVTLTATLTKGEFTETKVFDVVLKAWDAPYVSETKALPFENLATEYIVQNGTINIYYMNEGNIPYVDISEFIMTLKGAIISDDLVVVGDNNNLTVSYTYLAEEEGEEDYTLSMVYDFYENTLEINDFSFFDGLSEETQTDFGSGLETVDYIYTDPSIVTVDFDDYDFELVYENGKYMIPFHLANLFYSGGMYDAYYNGDKVYGVDTYQLMDDATIPSTIKSSSLNAADAPLDVKEANYDFVAFVFDYFYGLKDEQGVESYYTKLETYYRTFTTKDDKTMYNSLFRFAYSRDDLHTSHMFTGFYESNFSTQLTFNDLGTKSQFYYESYWDLEDACDSKSGYRVIDGGKTAIIFIEGFEAETPEEFKASIDAIIALGGVENIVVDLTCNRGGILGSAFQILGFMTDEPVAIHSKEVTDGSTESWYMTTANAKVDANWYILTSPVTFSAANLMTSVAKDMRIATIVGQQSSGGACSIAAILTPDGSGILISSTGMLTDSLYNSIEGGIPVDYEMNDVNSDQELIAIINGN